MVRAEARSYIELTKVLSSLEGRTQKCFMKWMRRKASETFEHGCCNGTPQRKLDRH